MKIIAFLILLNQALAIFGKNAQLNTVKIKFRELLACRLTCNITLNDVNCFYKIRVI